MVEFCLFLKSYITFELTSTIEDITSMSLSISGAAADAIFVYLLCWIGGEEGASCTADWTLADSCLTTDSAAFGSSFLALASFSA